MIPYGKQNINLQDIESVVEVLRSDFITQGPKVPEFEKSLCDYTGARYSVAVNSATSALHIACLALGLGEGDILWTSPISFVASANCGLYCGAEVDFVDIDPKTYNLCPKALAKKLETAKSTGQLPKIVVAVHLSGQSCIMEDIYDLSKQYNFKIVEDASHAVGGEYKGKKIGGNEYSDITVFSFHPVKIITTAEGGVALTNDSGLAEKMCLYRGHGVTRDAGLMTEESHGPWYYQQVGMGFNYRMTDLQAALGLSQLKRLDCFVNRRRYLAKRYDELLENLPIKLPYQIENAHSSYHLYIIRLQLEEIKYTRKQVFEMMRDKGVGVNVHYIPIHTQPYYKKLGFRVGDFSRAEEYYEQAISLPLFYSMSDEEQNVVVATLKEILTGSVI